MAAPIPRRFSLTDEEVAELRAEYERTGRFPNPHRSGFYHFFIEAMVNLGIDQWHPFTRLLDELRRLMSDPKTLLDGTTAWQRFGGDSKDDLTERFAKNIAVYQRLTGFTPFGRRLMEVGQKVLGHSEGAIVEMTTKSNGMSVRLKMGSKRTDSDIILDSTFD